MLKVPWFSYQHCLVPLPCCFSKDPLKPEFLEPEFISPRISDSVILEIHQL